MTEDSLWSQFENSHFGIIRIYQNQQSQMLPNDNPDFQSNEAPENDIYESDQSNDGEEEQRGWNEELEANGETGEAAAREAEAVFRKERVTNSIFKTSLSSYRKALIKTAQSNHQLQWLRVLINEVYDVRSKNQGIFPKLNYMVRKFHIEEAVNSKWEKEIASIILKKQNILTPKRYQQLLVDAAKIKKCIAVTDFWSCFKMYWGEFTQTTKYRNCEKDVKQFMSDFDRKIKDQSIIEEMKRKLPSLKRKKASNSKALKKKLSEKIYQETSHTE